MPEVPKIPRVGLRIVGPTTDDRYLKTSATNHVLAELTPAQVLADIGAADSSHTHVEADITDLQAYMLDVLDDTSPQLGGDLDLNGFDLVVGDNALNIEFNSASTKTLTVTNLGAGSTTLTVVGLIQNTGGALIQSSGGLSCLAGLDVATTSTLKGNVTIGGGTAGNKSLSFNAATNDGEMTWMDTEDYFKFSDDVFLEGAERMMFRGTGNYIGSSGADVLDIVVGTTLKLGNAATTVQLGISATTVSIASASVTSCAVGTGATTTLVGKTGGNTLLSDTGGTQRYFMPEVDGEWSLGDSTHEFRDGYFDGTVQTDVLRIDDGGKSSAVSATPTLLMASGGVTRDNAVWIPINLNGTNYWVPGWTDPAT